MDASVALPLCDSIVPGSGIATNPLPPLSRATLVEKLNASVASRRRSVTLLERGQIQGIIVTEFSDRILEILWGCPYGLTAKEIAERLGVTAGKISSRLSKLAAYGIIKKTRGRIAHNASARAIYHAPTSAPSTQSDLRGSTKSPRATKQNPVT
jgi:hypothetical protein